jgi:putative NADPH-quinone reductase
MATRIAIILGHPDPAGGCYGHALARAYVEGAAAAGHAARVIDVARLEFSVLRSAKDWENGVPAAAIRQAQETIAWAGHLLILYPLWLGSMPALLKAFLEQAFRPGFAIAKADGGRTWQKLLAGKSARIVVTMGMPAFVYRWYFRAHSLKSLERNILRFVGIGPIRETLIGMVETMDDAGRRKWLENLRALGSAGK